MSLKVKFCGAAGTVTGSCYLVTAGDTKFVIDCGMYQGPDVEYRNLEDFPFNPAEVDFALLTHSHLDHVGLFPKLVRDGFQGSIYATLNSIQIGNIILLDSAKIQENNFSRNIPWRFANKVALAYDNSNAEEAIRRFEVVKYDEEFEPAPGVKIRFVVAGHILGAASIEIEYEGKVIVFSGDIGREKQDLIPGFEHDYLREVDYVVMEALYGGVEHPDRSESVNEMITLMRNTINEGGSVYVPCFSVQRTQEILNDIKLAKEGGALDHDIPVWLDSPMAQRVTKVYTSALDHGADSNFNFPGLNYIKNGRRSAKMSGKRGQIIIAGSGMAEGGRILGHMAKNLKNPKDLFLFVGYQAVETRGRALTEGAKEVEIDEVRVPVKAKVVHLHGFSAHGDNSDYLLWLSRYNTPNLKKTFLVHAEPDRAEDFKRDLESKQIDHPYIPEWKEEVDLS